MAPEARRKKSAVKIHAMSEVVKYDANAGFDGLRIERSATGHAHSPWFSFDYSTELKRGLYNWNSQYHSISGHAKSAFASVLGIPVTAIIVSEKRDKEGEIWWRLGTIYSCEIPKKTSPKIPALKDAGPPAIDI